MLLNFQSSWPARVEEKPFLEEERKIGSENKNVCIPQKYTSSLPRGKSIIHKAILLSGRKI